MTLTLCVILMTIFLLLAALHFYWLFGGKWGLMYAFPTKNDHSHIHTPPKIATFLVACILLFLGFMYFAKSGISTIPIPVWVEKYAYWSVPALFSLRAIGEFKYLGFFKKIKHTRFAKADSRLFSPLCLGIAILAVLIQLLSP